MNTLKIIFVGEEGVGKSFMINAILEKTLAPIADIRPNHWSLNEYSMLFENYHLKLYDTPGIIKEYPESEIVSGLEGIHFDLIICCLDSTSSRLADMIQNSVEFNKKYLANVPVLFALTKANLLPDMNDQIPVIRKFVKENLKGQYPRYGLAFIQKTRPKDPNHSFWYCLRRLAISSDNLGVPNPYLNSPNHPVEPEPVPEPKPFLDKGLACKKIREYITREYRRIPEVVPTLRLNKKRIWALQIIRYILLAAYFICTLCLFISCWPDTFRIGIYFNIIRYSSLIIFVVLALLHIALLIYKYNVLRIYPVDVENLVTNDGYIFNGRIIFIFTDGLHFNFSGFVERDDDPYDFVYVNYTEKDLYELCCKRNNDPV